MMKKRIIEIWIRLSKIRISYFFDFQALALSLKFVFEFLRCGLGISCISFSSLSVASSSSNFSFISPRKSWFQARKFKDGEKFNYWEINWDKWKICLDVNKVHFDQSNFQPILNYLHVRFCDFYIIVDRWKIFAV